MPAPTGFTGRANWTTGARRRHRGLGLRGLRDDEALGVARLQERVQVLLRVGLLRADEVGHVLQGEDLPPVLLAEVLADFGYPPYSEALVVDAHDARCRRETLERFLRASAEGWRSYLANPAPGNALIKQAIRR